MRLDPTPFLLPALERKLLEPPLTHAFLEGNADRREENGRCHLRVQDGSGRTVKITIGRDLAPIRARADQFHAALPHHSPATIFFLQTGTAEVWAQTWIEGPTVEQAVGDLESAVKTVRALDDLESALETTAEASSWVAWEKEYDAWCQTRIESPPWTPAEKTILQQSVLPSLRTALRPSVPKHRLSNGDYLSTNIKLREDRAVLLDFEHGMRTHFSAEDHVRFLRLSAIAGRHPGLFAGIWPDPTPAWEIFFNVRQLNLEWAENTPEYLVREVPRRKANLRYALERAGFNVPDWSVASQPPPPVFATETMQLFWKTAGAWNEIQSKRITIRRGERQWVAFRLPAGAPSLRLDPAATNRVAFFKAIRAVQADGTMYDCSTNMTAVGADLDRTSEGLRISPHTSDPQLLLTLREPASFLVADVFIAER